MTAPEDQNGLREALARALAQRDAAVEKANELEAWCDRVAVLIKRQQGWQTYGQWLEADADAAMAHEIADQRAKVKAFQAEITRLKEGMEAAVGSVLWTLQVTPEINDWGQATVCLAPEEFERMRAVAADEKTRDPCARARCAATCPVAILDADGTACLDCAVPATLSPKEQP